MASRRCACAPRWNAPTARAPAWQGGWQARQHTDGGVDAAQAGLRVHAPPGAWRPAAGTAGTADTAVDLRQSSGTFAASPGFYLVEGPPWAVDSRLVRLYWHVSPAGAARLLAALTGMLADSGLPFQVKVLARSTAYGRADACVLYLDQAHFPVLAGELARIHARMRPWLDTAVPVYTHALAPGLGLAEQPPGGASFGRHRCTLLARALCADDARSGAPAYRLERVRARFADHGVALAQPFLNPGSQGGYVLPAARGPGRRTRPPAPAPQPGLLTAAARIGAELAGDAVWHADRCCWVGHLAGTGRPYGALGPALYDGTAGIAWFLAQLYAVTGEARLRTTAAGALRHACAAAESHADTGLYGGLAGVAWVSARCAALLDLPEFAARAVLLRAALAGRAHRAVNADVLGGVAGVVLGLLGADADDADGLAQEYGAALLRLAPRCWIIRLTPPF
ncbi:T3SS effector HopA1 family protein [Massilia phosphatilytica]